MNTDANTDPNIIHQERFVVRKRSKTREPIFFLVTQWQDANRNATIATIKIPTMTETEFESTRFVRDYCMAGIEAAGYAEKLNERVNGNKR